MAFLSGKVAVVTGGNRGIGRGIAEALAVEGAVVALTARARDDAERAAGEIGPSAQGFSCDVRDQAQVAGLFEQVARSCGGVDVLVNNAGIGIFGPVAEMRPEDWR